MQHRSPLCRRLAVAALVSASLAVNAAHAVPPPVGTPEGMPAPAQIPAPAEPASTAKNGASTGNSATAATKTAPTGKAGTTSATATSTASTGTATETTSTSGITQLPPIIVTAATRDAQPVDTTATSSSVVTNGQIDNQKYARVADALASLPGLAVVTSGAPGQATSVFTRGTNSDQTLLTIDGRRQAPDFDNFYDFTNLTFDNVEQVEVVRTPASSLQGGNAIGGVINLVTQSGRGVAPEGSVAFEGGSFQTYRGIASSRGQIGDFDYSASFSRQDSTFPRPNDFYDNNTYRGNYGYQIAPNVYFDLQTSYVSWRTGDPSEVPFPDPTGKLTRETWNISPRITANVTDFYTTSFYYNRTQQRQVDNDPTEFTLDRFQVDVNSYDWQNDFQIARNWKITAGVQSDDEDVSEYDNIANVRDVQNSLTSVGGYIQSQWQPIEGLNVISSGRYDHYSDFDGAFSWRQGVAYTTPVTATVLHASVSSSYVTPTVDDLYSPGFFGFAVGNPNLKPEKDLAWEAGVQQPFWNNRVSASATYFHNDLRDLIEDVGAFDTPENIQHATTDGVELGVTAQPLSNVWLNLNYTYLNAVDDTDQTRLLRRPRNSFNFTTTYKPIDSVTIGLGGSWVVGREDIDPVSDATVDAPDYFTMRASVTWQINQMVSVWFRGENITGVSYQPALGFPAPGAAAYGGVKFSF